MKLCPWAMANKSLEESGSRAFVVCKDTCKTFTDHSILGHGAKSTVLLVSVRQESC
jgi:hypothetical protein